MAYIPHLNAFMYDDNLTPMARLFIAHVFESYKKEIDYEVDDQRDSDLFHVSPRHISNLRTELKQVGYIREEHYKKGKKRIVFNSSLDDRSLIKNNGTMKVSYKIDENKFITSTDEAMSYFHSLIDKSDYADKSKTTLRHFCNVFANALFEETSYGITLGELTLTKEFYQFVINGFSIDMICETAQRVMKGYFEKIVNIRLYVLSSIVNLYKGDFELWLENPKSYEWRKRMHEEAQRAEAEERFEKNTKSIIFMANRR